MKKQVSDDPTNWSFESNDYNLIGNIFKSKRFILSVIGIVVITALFLFLAWHFDGFVEPKTILLVGESVFIMLLIPVIWIVMKNTLKKYWPMVAFPVIALISVNIVLHLFDGVLVSEATSISRADILSFSGDFLAFVGSFCLGYFIYIQNRSTMIEEKRTKIRLLLSSINDANDGLIRLSRLVSDKNYLRNPQNRNLIKTISYDPNWLLYYYEYEALKGENPDLQKTISLFFHNISNVNAAIESGQIELADTINTNHIKNSMYSIQKYSELEAILCLQDACNDFHFFKAKSCFELKENIQQINKLCQKYYYIIENFVFNWLIQHHVDTTTESDDLNREIVDWLISNSSEIKEIDRKPDGKRIISKVVFDCSLKFREKSKKVNYIWGEYSLKDNEKGASD